MNTHVLALTPVFSPENHDVSVGGVWLQAGAGVLVAFAVAAVVAGVIYLCSKKGPGRLQGALVGGLVSSILAGVVGASALSLVVYVNPPTHRDAAELQEWAGDNLDVTMSLKIASEMLTYEDMHNNPRADGRVRALDPEDFVVASADGAEFPAQLVEVRGGFSLVNYETGDRVTGR